MSVAGKRALARAEAGAEVTICGRRPEPLQALAATARGLTPAVCDTTAEASVIACFEQAGPQDIVIANAGISASAPFLKTGLQDFRAMVDTNLTGTFLPLRERLRAMQGKDWGQVVAIASTASLKGYAYVAPYAAAKHGVLGLVRSVALEFARKSIKVNAICPGFLDTEMTRQSVRRISATAGRTEAEARAALEATNPMRRLVPPEHVARAVLWLCGPGSDMVTRQAISVSGAETM